VYFYFVYLLLLSFESHVSSICKTAFFHLKNIEIYLNEDKCGKVSSCIHDLKARVMLFWLVALHLC